MSESIISVIGVGDAASRIVSKLECNFSSTEYISFNTLGMNEMELSSLNLKNKFLIGSGNLDSWTDREKIRCNIQLSIPTIDRIFIKQSMSIFMVCLDDDFSEESIKTFLEEAQKMKVDIRYMIVELPHSCEGKERRASALKCIEEIKELCEGYTVVDYEDFKDTTTINELYSLASAKMIDIANTILKSITTHTMLAFDYNDVKMFFLNQGKNRINFITYDGTTEELIENDTLIGNDIMTFNPTDVLGVLSVNKSIINQKNFFLYLTNAYKGWSEKVRFIYTILPNEENTNNVHLSFYIK